MFHWNLCICFASISCFFYLVITVGRLEAFFRSFQIFKNAMEKFFSVFFFNNRHEKCGEDNFSLFIHFYHVPELLGTISTSEKKKIWSSIKKNVYSLLLAFTPTTSAIHAATSPCYLKKIQNKNNQYCQIHLMNLISRIITM